MASRDSDHYSGEQGEVMIPVRWLVDARQDVRQALRELDLTYTERDEHHAAAVDWLSWADRRLRDCVKPKNQLAF